MHTDVVLVRHAASVPPTADGPDQLTRPLTAAGLRQAAELVPALIEPRPVAVWSSPYRRAIRDLAREHEGRVVLVASHGMFVARALYGFGRPVGWDFWRRMPMPAVHRLRVTAESGI
jgi:broad specificity phosphatase PhoE